MLKNNLIYIKIHKNHFGFLDTGGNVNIQFRQPKVRTGYHYREIAELDFLSNNVILFLGNEYWKNKIFIFDYVNGVFGFITRSRIPHSLISYKMFNKKANFALFKIQFDGKQEMFLFDTGATHTNKNNRNFGISFLDGRMFDKIASTRKYRVIDNYDIDGSPCMIIPEITVFGKVIKNAKFLRRRNNAFYKWMSSVVGVKHCGAIGGNILKYFTIIADFKGKCFYV